MQNSGPNLFILGAAKAGTTTLHDCLAAHPEIYMTRVKEPQFFSHDDVYSRGIDWYRDEFFAGSAAYRVRGESTPHYLFYEKAAQRIAKDLPTSALRFIVMVREPVARAYSLYWNMVAEGMEDLSFEQALAAEDERSRDVALQHEGAVSVQYVQSSLYARQIKTYLKYFGREQFHVVVLEDFKQAPERVLDEICAFLGVAPFGVLPQVGSSNAAGMPRSPWLQRFLRGSSVAKKVFGSMIPQRYKYPIVELALKMNKRRTVYVPMSDELAQQLRARFADDVRELELLTGKTLGRWWPELGAQSVDSVKVAPGVAYGGEART